MLTISQLAAYAGVTVRAVRHYHQIGLLPEPERGASGYRRYGALAVVSLIKIRTLADAGVPLSEIGRMLDADASTFAETVERIDNRLRDEIERLETSRKQIAQLAAGDSLALPSEVIFYLDRLREIVASERIVRSERDGWILVVARWPAGPLARWPAGPLARWPAGPIASASGCPTNSRSSRIRDSSGSIGSCRRYRTATQTPTRYWRPVFWRRPPTSWPAWPSRPTPPARSGPDEAADDDVSFGLLDALAVESDPRAQRLLGLMRERGWGSWTRTRPERPAERPD